MSVTDAPTAAASHEALTPEALPRSDAEIAQQIRQHHAGMVADLDGLTATLRDAPTEEQGAARARLQAWFETVLVPHADEEEATTYRAAGELSEGRLLIEAMVREHLLIKRLVALFRESEAAAAAAYARAVLEAFTSHQGKENEVILPLLVAAPRVSLAAVMGGAHGHQVGEHAHQVGEHAHVEGHHHH
jgi:hypothetical protein